MSSKTFTVPPILGCLKAAEEYLRDEIGWNDRKVQWAGISHIQNEFVDAFASCIPEVDAIQDILTRIAHKDHTVINKWLRDHGFNIQLEGPSDDQTFAVASILDVLVKWQKKGLKTTVEHLGSTYPAVKLKDNQGVVIMTGKGSNPIAAIQTQGKDKVFMTIVDEEPADAMAIVKLIQSLLDGVRPDSSYDSVVFPMVDYDQKVDISWLQGLQTGTSMSDWRITEALQQTIFRMNEVGARSKSAASMMMSKGRCIEPPKETFIINRPFLLWIKRKGISMPLFAGVFGTDCWKEPESL